MTYFIITTNNDNYPALLNGQPFSEDGSFCIEPANSALVKVYKYEYNDNYTLLLPAVVNPNLSEAQRRVTIVEYVRLIAEELKIEKNNLYSIVHAGDLYDEANIDTGIVKDNDVTELFQEIIPEGHLCDFHHDESIADLIFHKDIDDAFFSQLLDLF